MKKFFAGITVACLLQPTMTLITHLSEWAKSAISIKIVKNNLEVENFNNKFNQNDQTRVIGFQVQNYSEGEQEDGE